MRILYISQYFPPEMGAPSARVHELSREWVRMGHEVTVVTGFAHHPTGRKAAGDRYRLTRREFVDGIDVVRSYVWATANKGIVKRMVSYASFMVSAAVIGSLRAKNPDVVIATSPQLLCGLAGYLVARRFGAPFVFEVRDLWPESILAVEAMQENFVVRSLRGLASFLYSHSTRIVTVGNGYKQEINERYGIPLGHMEVVPNGIDTSLFVPKRRENELRREFGWGDRFVVLYVGTLGMAHALNSVLGAAEKLRDRPDILFVFVGEGAEKDNLKNLAFKKSLHNVQFIDQQPKHRMPLLYGACDIGLVTLRAAKLFQSVLPSKMFEYLGMEKPVIVSVDGEARELVERAQSGWYVPPEDAEALSDAVVRGYQDTELLSGMGERGRNYVLQRYTRDFLAAQYIDLLKRLLKSPLRCARL
ncbi:MAG TPA: glycosyltransferase family 4 protein [Desulfomonilaceae bacterium]|nr:glycosyltransferase family 4 protein [Desulfomonilaceae bacterium]